MAKISAQEKRWETGEKLYNEFVETIADSFEIPSRVSTPSTFSLEKFALLAKRANLRDMLYTEMMREYLTNFNDFDVSVEKGALYHKLETKVRF